MKFFEQNIGKTDKIVRTIVGIIGLFGSLFVSAPLSYIMAIIGAILILTAIFGTCGLYTVLKINTNQSDLKKEETIITKKVTKKKIVKKKKK